MSITSSNNLAVSNSLTVSGNTILGSDNTKTLIVNSLQTFNNGTTINGNITQNSGILNTTSDTNYLNGNVIIGAYKTLTTGGGTTTINGLTQANNNIYVLSGKSLYITDSILSKYLRNYHDGTNAYIDYTGDLNFRNSGATTSLTISSSTNQGTFNYVLNTKGITNGTTTLTNNATLTQNGIGYFADNIRVSPGKSVYITDATTSNYIRLLHTGTSGSSFIDFTGDLNVRNAGSTYPLTISSTTNQGTFNYMLNTTGINNIAGYLTTKSIDITDTGSCSVDMKTTGNNSDYDVRLSCSGGSSATSGLGTLEIIASTLINGATLTQNGTANMNSALNVAGLPFFNGASNQTLPTVASGSAGLSIYWNGTASSHGETNFMNNAQGGDGGFSWHTRTSVAVPRKIMYLDTNGSLSSIKDVAMSGNCTITGNCIPNAVSLGYSTLPTFTSSMIGYQSTTYLTTTTSITSGSNYTLFSFTLPMGVWNVRISLVFYASVGSITINLFTLTTSNASTTVNINTDMNNQAMIIPSTTSSVYNNSYFYQSSTSTTYNINYTQQTYTGSGLQVLGSSTNSLVQITRIA